MPADYFVTRRKPRLERGPLVTLFWLLRNTLAVLLVLAGIAMLVLPGQGLLTILIGIGISTFPGKYRIERAIMRRAAVYRSANWIRRRAGRIPLQYPAAGDDSGPDTPD
nr:PGPGW domain-containing protein [Alcanivorax quisquiliarum]